MKILKIILATFVVAMTPVLSMAAPKTPIGTLDTPDPAALAAFKKDIRVLYDLKEKAFADADAAAIVNHFYTADAVTVGPDGKATSGRAGFLENYKPLVSKYNVRVESILTYLQGDAGWDWANFHITSKDGSEPPFSFIILFLWNKVDGKWASPGDMYVVGQFSKPAN